MELWKQAVRDEQVVVVGVLVIVELCISQITAAARSPALTWTKHITMTMTTTITARNISLVRMLNVDHSGGGYDNGLNNGGEDDSDIHLCTSI